MSRGVMVHRVSYLILDQDVPEFLSLARYFAAPSIIILKISSETCPAGVSNTLLHHQIKGLALAQCPVFSLSMQIFLLSDSLSYPQRVSYYLTLFHTGLTYYFHDIGYPIIYPIVTFAYRKVKKYPINNSSSITGVGR